MIVYFI